MTTRLGVSPMEAAYPGTADAYLDVLRTYPGISTATIWSRLNDERHGIPGRRLDERLLDGMGDRSLRPFVFGESYLPYAEIRAGQHDDRLRDWGKALKGRGAWLRFDQEANGGTPGDPTFPWQAETSHDYRQTFAYAREVVRSEAPDVLFCYSPSVRSRDLESITDRFPWGAVDVAGWTSYQTKTRRPAVRRGWANLMAWYSVVVPDAPKAVTECGRLVALPEREAYYADLHRVIGVDVIIPFDMNLRRPDGTVIARHSWKMTAQQRRRFLQG